MERTGKELTQTMLQAIGMVGIIVTIPLVFGAVQPVVWSFYAGLMICFFSVEWLRGKIDFRFLYNPLLFFSAGLFLIYSLLQIIPIPQSMMSFLSPFQQQVYEYSHILTGNTMKWRPLSYVWRDSLAWWIFLVGLLLFGQLLKEYISKTKNLVIVVGAMAVLALFESVYGLVQALIPTLGVLWAETDAYLGDARGTFINRNHFAGFIEMVWLLMLGLSFGLAQMWRQDGYARAEGAIGTKYFLTSDRIGLQLLLWAAMLFILLALLFSKSRAGIAGALIGFISFLTLAHIGGKRFSWPAWAAMGSGLVLLLFYGNVIGFENIIGRFLDIDEHAGSRANIWMDTIEIIRHHPFGIGLGNYEHVIPIYNSTGPIGITYRHAHNDYLQIMAESGWPGFILLAGGFSVFLGASIRRIVRLGPDIDPLRFNIGVGACAGLISIAFHSFFDFNLQIPSNLLYFVVLIVILHECGKTRIHRL